VRESLVNGALAFVRLGASWLRKRENLSFCFLVSSKERGLTPGLCGGFRNGRGGRVMAAEMVDDGEMGEG